MTNTINENLDEPVRQVGCLYLFAFLGSLPALWFFPKMASIVIGTIWIFVFLFVWIQSRRELFKNKNLDDEETFWANKYSFYFTIPLAASRLAQGAATFQMLTIFWACYLAYRGMWWYIIIPVLVNRICSHLRITCEPIWIAWDIAKNFSGRNWDFERHHKIFILKSIQEKLAKNMSIQAEGVKNTIPIDRFTGEPNPFEIGELSKDPVGFLEQLSQRKYWREIDLAVLTEISDEANGNMEFLSAFVFISETEGLVKNNYIRASNPSEGGLPPRVAFSCTLYFLGVRKLKAFYQAVCPEDRRHETLMADMAFSSSLLCNPFQIASYAYLANLYASRDTKVALEFCEKYRNARDKLMNTPAESLSDFNRVVKFELENPAGYTEFFDKISRMGGPSIEGHTSANINRFVEELDQALRGLDSQDSRDDAVDAVRKAIEQML